LRLLITEEPYPIKTKMRGDETPTLVKNIAVNGTIGFHETLAVKPEVSIALHRTLYFITPPSWRDLRKVGHHRLPDYYWCSLTI